MFLAQAHSMIDTRFPIHVIQVLQVCRFGLQLNIGEVVRGCTESSVGFLVSMIFTRISD